MKLPIIILTIALFLTACNQESKTEEQSNRVDTTETAKLTNNQRTAKRLSFKDMSEIIADSSYSTWVDEHDSSFSLALHFQEKDTVAFSYSPECWIIFPYKYDKSKLIVFWDNNIDTKYEFDIVKAMKKVDKKFIGKPFMTLELMNDTTLSATYHMNDVRGLINRSNKQRTFFPGKFILVQEGEMYD